MKIMKNSKSSLSLESDINNNKIDESNINMLTVPKLKNRSLTYRKSSILIVEQNIDSNNRININHKTPDFLSIN